MNPDRNDNRPLEPDLIDELAGFEEELARYALAQTPDAEPSPELRDRILSAVDSAE
ncbi:MAG: hypothetical protein ACI8UO_000494 [Verrucomicrobiales bacterium]|jgi:hypothetical protein